MKTTLPTVPMTSPSCRHLLHNGASYGCALGGACEQASKDITKLDACTRGFVRAMRANEQVRRAPVTVHQESCVHLGDVIGQEAGCAGCGGKMNPPIDIHRCAIHKECTLTSELPGMARCKKCPDKEELQWITTKQLAEDSVQLASMLPADVARVMGIPRSGMIPAAIIATHLHLPLYAFDGTPKGKLLAGNSRGWARLDGATVVVDDTVWMGGAMNRVRAARAKEPGKTLYASVYLQSRLAPAVDFHVRVATKAPLEWNVFNHHGFFLAGLACDFDGILCHDPNVPDADDGPLLERYRRWLIDAKPLHIPRAQSVRLIVTARLEQFRRETESWLKRWGIRWDKLIMHPALKGSQRGDVAAWKARHYRESTAVFFLESDPAQAQRIFTLSHKQVICPSAAKVWR